MKIEKTIEDNHEAKLVVEVEPEQMETYKRRAARKISERGKIPGFRPGKAPYEMIVRNYGEQAILEQAVDNFVDAEYSNRRSRHAGNRSAAGGADSGATATTAVPWPGWLEIRTWPPIFSARSFMFIRPRCAPLPGGWPAGTKPAPSSDTRRTGRLRRSRARPQS